MCAPDVLLWEAPVPGKTLQTPLPASMAARNLSEVRRLYAALRAVGIGPNDPETARLAREVALSRRRGQFRCTKIHGCTITIHL